MLDDAIDVAVHSAKDVPAELAEGLELVAFPRRADPRDVICGAASLGELEPGSRVGTSSLRRAAQIKAVREDLEIVSVRGNVDTRLRKLSEGQLSGTRGNSEYLLRRVQEAYAVSRIEAERQVADWQARQVDRLAPAAHGG